MTKIQRYIKQNPQGRIRYVGFDMDGTLIDTMQAHASMFGQYITERFSIAAQESGSHYIQTAGHPTADQITSLLKKHSVTISAEQAVQMGQEFDTMVEHVEASPFPEVTDILNQLKDNGYYIFVSSSHPTEAIERILQKAELLQYVDFFLGTDPQNPDLRKGEPHFRKSAEYFNVPYNLFIEKAVFVGDGSSDMQAAITSNVIAIGRVGTKTKKDLIDAGASITLSDLSKLPELLPSL
jgi:phosphoglycolate phosphatase-like HAD superfamily hydrolase